MRAPFAPHRFSRSAQALVSLTILVPVLGGANGVLADEPAHMRVGAVSASRRTCAAETLCFCLLLQGRSAPSLAEMEKQLPIGYEGVSAAEMAKLCESAGVPIRARQTTIPDLALLSSPSILHVEDSHFIVFVRLDGDRLVLFDNMIGLLDCSRGWFRERYQWRGTALVLGERTTPLWFLLRSPWPVAFSAGLFATMLGLHMLLAHAAKRETARSVPA